MANELKKAFMERQLLAIRQNQSLEFLPEWLIANTTSPTDPTSKWSFEGHEYQIDILKSTAFLQSTLKCSQVGMSELASRKAVALAALRSGVQIIYTLPTGAFAQMFSKTRVDPIIEGSPTLSALIDNETNNTKLKRIGSSFMHFVGTYSASAPISIPASYVISDETDFSNQEILSEFASRMGHQKESESANIRFSTPTVDGFSISADYEASSQGRYAVKCDECEEWQRPDFLDDVVIPDWSTPVAELTRFDVASMPREIADGAYLSCPNCKADLTTALLDKDKRKWIHKFPERQKRHEGFKVVPYDVPTINPVGRTIRQILDYKKIASWYNFKLGETFSDESTRFELDTIDLNTRVVFGKPVYGAVMGVDVGKKQTWVSIGVPSISIATGDVEQLDIISLTVLDSTQGAPLGEQILEIAHKNMVVALVCDAAPDFSTAQYLHKTLITGRAFGNYYTQSSTFKKEMTFYRTDERKGVCLSDRTGSIDDLRSMVNGGNVSFPAGEEMERLKEHLDAVKRITSAEGEDGEDRWVTRNKADDHWLHSLNYLLLAAQISGGTGVGRLMSLAPSIKGVNMKGRGDPDPNQPHLNRPNRNNLLAQVK